MRKVFKINILVLGSVFLLLTQSCKKKLFGHVTISGKIVNFYTHQPESTYINIYGNEGPTGGWADYVFANNYKLKPLQEIERYVAQNKHLPNVPSAQEIEENGNNLAKTDAILLQKIEELTLYMVEQGKELEKIKQENKELKKILSGLKNK